MAAYRLGLTNSCINCYIINEISKIELANYLSVYFNSFASNTLYLIAIIRVEKEDEFDFVGIGMSVMNMGR